MTRIPNGDRAVVDIRKLEQYCLSSSHPRGRHKARVFREALGIGQADAAWLRGVLLEAVGEGEALKLASDAFGTRWQIDATVTRNRKRAMIRTIWMVRVGEDVPRFVTCWVL